MSKHESGAQSGREGQIKDSNIVKVKDYFGFVIQNLEVQITIIV